MYLIAISSNSVLTILWLVPSSWVGVFILPFDLHHVSCAG